MGLEQYFLSHAMELRVDARVVGRWTVGSYFVGSVSSASIRGVALTLTTILTSAL